MTQKLSGTAVSLTLLILSDRSCSPKAKGGDRKSDEYKQTRTINRV